MVSALILLVFRWHILERTEMWTRSKENCSSDATSVYVCEWNKEFWENTTIKEYIIEWVINGATASLSLLNTSGSVDTQRYQWLSNTYACHYILTFRSNYEAYCHSISTRNIDLNVDAARITDSCASSRVILVVPVDLHSLCVRSSECKHVMSSIGVG